MDDNGIACDVQLATALAIRNFLFLFPKISSNARFYATYLVS